LLGRSHAATNSYKTLVSAISALGAHGIAPRLRAAMFVVTMSL